MGLRPDLIAVHRFRRCTRFFSEALAVGFDELKASLRAERGQRLLRFSLCSSHPSPTFEVL